MARYITKRFWTEVRKSNPELVARVEDVLDESLIVERYASNVENSLRSRGENDLASRFMGAVDGVTSGELKVCAKCGDTIRYGTAHDGKVYCKQCTWDLNL